MNTLLLALLLISPVLWLRIKAPQPRAVSERLQRRTPEQHDQRTEVPDDRC
jgi:hypothetical protein